MRVLILLLALAAGGLAEAATLYQWKDEAGVVHFTDNPANVPPQYREQGKREVKGVQTTASALGERIWKEKCAECHFMGEGLMETSDGKGKRGLRRFVFDASTGFPYPDETVRAGLSPYLDGSSQSMPAVELSDGELISLIKYMQRVSQAR